MPQDFDSRLRYLSYFEELCSSDSDSGTVASGVKLYDACRASGVPSVRLVSFDAAKRLGHSDIYRDAGLPDILQEFVKHCLEGDSDT